MDIIEKLNAGALKTNEEALELLNGYYKTFGAEDGEIRYGISYDDYPDINMTDLAKQYRNLFDFVERVGGEGQGENCYQVVKFKPTDTYFIIHGYYDSYEGFDFECGDWRETEKVKVVREEWK